MMHVGHAHVAVVFKQGDALIKADSKQLAALCQVNGVIEESGRRIKSALRG